MDLQMKTIFQSLCIIGPSIIATLGFPSAFALMS